MCGYFDSIFNIAFCLSLPVYRVWYGTPTFKMGSYGRWIIHLFQSRFKVQDGFQSILWSNVGPCLLVFCMSTLLRSINLATCLATPFITCWFLACHILLSPCTLCQCLLFPFSICFSLAPWVRDPYCADFETVVSFLLLIISSYPKHELYSFHFYMIDWLIRFSQSVESSSSFPFLPLCIVIDAPSFLPEWTLFSRCATSKLKMSKLASSLAS